MPRPISAIARLLADSKRVTPIVAKGRRLSMADEGTGSLALWPLLALAKKLKGKDKVQRALYEHWHRPLKNLDEKGGKALSDAFGTKKLFRQIDVLPTTRKMDGNRALIEHDTYSATAPISKASKIVTPIAAAMYGSQLLGDLEESKMASDQKETPGALLKEAADALTVAHRRHEAEKLAFAMVERGKISPFKSYEEFQEKVASVMAKDLAVVQEALEMDSPLAEFGKVASAGPNTSDAHEMFFHRLASED